MNIFDYAMELEKEGEVLYNDFAKKASNEGMTKIFTWLSEQEKKHYESFAKLKAKEEVSLNDAEFLTGVKNIFTDWKKQKDNFDSDISQVELYNNALDIEQKSIDFYIEKSNEVTNEKQKELLIKIAAEEKSHKEIMENIIEYVTKPETWVENAEFTHIGEEY